MKIAIIVISVLAIVALAIGGCVHRYKTPEKRAEYITQKITKKLDLNNEQKVRLEAVKNEMLSVRKQMHGKREATKANVQDLLSTPNFDQDKALSIVDGHVNEISTQAPQIVTALADFWDSLNPEQQSRIREKFEEHFEDDGHWGHGYGHRM